MHIKNIRILFISICIILTGFTSIVLISNTQQKKSEDISDVCRNKQIIWGNSQYDIVDLQLNTKIVMKVTDRNEKSWHVALAPIQKPKTVFDTCEASVVKAPPDVLRSPDTPSEVKADLSRGLTVSIGRETASEYQHIADFTLRIFLSAHRNDTENFDLDAAMKDLSEHFVLKNQSDGTLQLVFTGNVREDFKDQEKFIYEVIELNGEWIGTGSMLLISRDGGKSWKATLVESQ